MSMAKVDQQAAVRANWPKEWLQELKARDAGAADELKAQIKAHRDLRKLAGFALDGREIVEKNEVRIPITSNLGLGTLLSFKEDKPERGKEALPRKRKKSPSPEPRVEPSRKSQRKVKPNQSKITEHFAYTLKKKS
mmetsp:Transcript_23546/g.41736  ORF Transcript_23546/g.41736 Transcript_23546/m.41736 type:complete len:136 (-) Transcript_23546:291-698(-)